MVFDRNVPQLFFVFSLYQCLQRTVKNEQKQISISKHHSWVPRWRAFNFAQVLFRCVLEMPSNSAIKAGLLKTCIQKVLIFEKKNLVNSWIWTHDLKSVALTIEPYGCGFWWNVARVFSSSSSSTCCRTQSDHRITSWWQTWRGRMMGYSVRQLIWRCWQSQAS